jgi:hypothetical protein
LHGKEKDLVRGGRGEVPGKTKLEGRRSVTSEGKSLAGIDRFSALRGVHKPRSEQGEIMLIRCHENILTDL